MDQRNPSIDVINMLPSCFEPLKTALKTTLTCKNEYDFFYNLAQVVMPILTNVPLLETLRQEWEGKIYAYHQQYGQLRKAAKKEIKKTYDLLRKRIRRSREHLEENEKNILNFLERLYNNQEPFFSPPEYEIACNQLCSLCSSFVERERYNLVQGLVKLSVLNQTDNKTSEQEAKQAITRRIIGYSFRKNLEKAKNLELRSIQHSSEQIYMQWERLRLVEWAWKTDLSYYKKKKISSDSALKRQRSMDFCNQVDLINEMNTIKKLDPLKNEARKPSSILHFNMTLLKRSLETIVSSISMGIKEEYSDVFSEKTIIVSSLELDLKGEEELWLEIVWKQNSKPEKYLLISFRSRESAPCSFIRKIINQPPGTIIKTAQRSISDLCWRMNLKCGLYENFFSARHTKSAQFQGKKITNLKLGERKHRELLEHLLRCNQKDLENRRNFL